MLLLYILLITLPYLLPIFCFFLAIKIITITSEYSLVYIFRLITYISKYLGFFLYLILINFLSHDRYYNNVEIYKKNLFIPLILKKVTNCNSIYYIYIYHVILTIPTYVLLTFIFHLIHIIIIENLFLFIKNEFLLTRIVKYIKNKYKINRYILSNNKISISISYNVFKRFWHETFNLYLAMKLKTKIPKLKKLDYFRYFNKRIFIYIIDDRYLLTLLIWIRYK